MGFNEYDTRLAYVSIADAMRLANVRRLVSGVELRFDDPMLALSAGKEVQRRLGSPHHLVDWKELNQQPVPGARLSRRCSSRSSW